MPNSSKTATAFWVRVLKAFCSESGTPLDLTTWSPGELNYFAAFTLALGTRTGNITSGPPA